MDKIKVEICCGTACYLLGASQMMDLEDTLPEAYRDRVEILPRTCLGRNSGEMLDLLSADPRLRACCDTNHLLTEDLPGFIRRLGDRVETLHVSDYDGKDEKHWLPGEGVLPWPEVLAALAEVGYKGPWLYEIGLGTPKTIVRDRPLAFPDFSRNAGELFEGRRPTVFSHPITPDVCG